ncbi:MAG: helix-turn-helix domain-containing protein [Alcaligenaceae bacterium]|nr:helix-turn-helix domain-containing protein [Alcaligenaceae bacterium]
MIITTPRTLAVYLRDYRKRQKLSQSEIANKVGLRQATISDFEKNPDKVTIETVLKIVSALELEIQLNTKPNHEEGGDSW